MFRTFPPVRRSIEVNERWIERSPQRTANMSTQKMFQEGRNGAEPPEGHRHLIQIFYKNLTASWQQSIPFPLDLARVSIVVRKQAGPLPNIAKMK